MNVPASKGNTINDFGLAAPVSGTKMKLKPGPKKQEKLFSAGEPSSTDTPPKKRGRPPSNPLSGALGRNSVASSVDGGPGPAEEPPQREHPSAHPFWANVDKYFVEPTASDIAALETLTKEVKLGAKLQKVPPLARYYQDVWNEQDFESSDVDIAQKRRLRYRCSPHVERCHNAGVEEIGKVTKRLIAAMLTTSDDELSKSKAVTAYGNVSEGGSPTACIFLICILFNGTSLLPYHR